MKEYETINGMAERLKVSVSTVKRRLEEFRRTTHDDAALIDDGRLVRIRFEDFCQFLNGRRRA